MSGRVTVAGRLPLPAARARRPSDPLCGHQPLEPEIAAAADGALANVLVHLDGLPAAAAPEPKVTWSQAGCSFRPRILGVVAGQRVALHNGDPVLHSVQGHDGARLLFDLVQVPGAPDPELPPVEAGQLLQVSCGEHPETLGYLWVQRRPAFAVSDPEGRFHIANVPPGRWEVSAWHERLGTQRGAITVAGGRPSRIDFTFTSESGHP